MTSRHTNLPLALFIVLALPVSQARAQDQAPPPPPPADPAPTAVAPADPSLETRLDEIDQRSRIAERKLELLEEDAAKAKAATPVVTASDKGFNFKSADGAFLVKVRGLVHADSRSYLGDKDLRPRDTFLVRRARPLLEATFLNIADFRLMPDFGGNQAIIQDAYGDLRPFAWLKLRFGKFKPPVGLERLQSASAITFVERGLPTNLVPNRDIGVQLHGDIAGGVVSYAVGIFNGALDNAATPDSDNNHGKDFAGRIFLQPLKNDPYSPLAGLGVGVGASTGSRRGTQATFTGSGASLKLGTASVSNLPGLRTAGQQAFFSYLVSDAAPGGTVVAEGRSDRVSPQAYYYLGGFGLLAEYVVSRNKVLKGTTATKLTNTAWQVATSFVLGGKNAFEGVSVDQPFDLAACTFGAVEIGARYGQLKVDKDTFPLYADPAKSAAEVKEAGVVASWYWNKNIKLSANYEQSSFKGGIKDADRKTEKVLFTRLQTAF